MTIPMEGIDRTALLDTLESFRANDLAWRSGRVLAYTYGLEEEVEDVAKNAYMMYLGENGLDPTTFPSMHRIETQITRTLRDLLRGDDEVVGNCTFGGTESIICAIKTARDWARVHRPEIAAPEIIVPVTAHPAHHKAGLYLGLKVVVSPINPETYQADVEGMRALITPNTILLAGSAPGYAQGVVDPIPEIAALALEHGLLCHVDACVGGIHLSFHRRMKPVNFPDFDFSVPGVTSISLDMHKYGYAPKNISTIMYRNKALRRYQYYACRKTTTYALINATVLSTKSGGPLAGAWAVLNFLGEGGYRQIVQGVNECTWKMVDGINAIPGLRVLGKPDMCMFSFAADDFNIFQLADEMRDRGWYLQPQFSTAQSPPNLHVTVTRTSIPHVDNLLKDLAEAAEAVRNHPEPIDPKAVREQVQAMLSTMEGGPEAIAQLAAVAGLQGTDLPQHMALINTVMDALPDELAEMILIEFMNDLYV
jgi:sphinganine-1-phosphate aldolase